MFGRRLRHPHLLSDLINAVRHPAAPVSISAILNPNLLPDTPSGKQVFFDILAQDTAGQQFIVEMQMRRHAAWPARNAYYLARGLAQQLVSGQDYDALRPSIGITLLGQDWYANPSDQSDWRFTLRDARALSLEFDQALQLYVVELRKAGALRQGHPALKDWVVCLSNDLNEDIMNQITHPPALEAMQHLEAMYSEEELRQIAFEREKVERDTLWVLNGAKTEGYQDVLIRQLIRRFGEIPREIEFKVRNARAEQLLAWLDNVMDAPTIEDVLRWDKAY
ncbi:PD-(D/E)XK nuclease family transposase [Bordetella ansorpii]|uniref:PD-(D/E)XK nuclease family transposase n=1 Tax=Bordetella ansorpii TaxID=288768 RepID=A0A157SW54_9BORD|nr:PD-(D/E)XK nuclease family transposase [Bordetella ansorpii]SAI74677.1 PD-(D/E)XK nuclease family transposase [Bordetella ansorpii]